MRRATWEGASASCVVVSGNHLPNPIPPRVRRHSFIARPAHGACGVFRSMPESGPGWQCRLPGTHTWEPPPGPLPAPGRNASPGRRARRPGVPEPTLPGEPAVARRPVRNLPHELRPARPGGRYSAAPRHPRPAGRAGPAGTTLPLPGGAQGRTGALGRAPVERLISAHATVHFQPTSETGRFLVEMADQPPCHQAGRDRAVRFRPMGTGHERRTHFPVRPASETLRDRTLPARLPCRQ